LALEDPLKCLNRFRRQRLSALAIGLVGVASLWVPAMATDSTAGASAAGAPLKFTESELALSRYGTIAIYRPSGPIRAVVIFLSGDGGWNLGVVDMARRFAAAGALVAGVDVRRYLELLRPKNPELPAATCTSVADDMEALSQQLQRNLHLPGYQHPLLVGYSSGATIVYAALAQAPHGTFAGAMSMGFCPDQDFAGARLCKTNGLDYHLPGKIKTGDHTLILDADRTIREPWIAVQGERDQVCDPEVTRKFSALVPAAKLLSLPRVGHGFSVTANWWPQVRQAFQETIERAAPPVPTDSSINDLPVYEVPAGDRQGNRLAILLTGDGGWAGLDQDLSAELASKGISVAALSSVRYFWQARTPEQSAADVARLIDHFLPLWHAQRVLLIGYSFGADALPFIWNRLPQRLQEHVDSLSLLGLSASANFEIQVSGWLPGAGGGDRPTLPELQRITGLPLLCVYGNGESDSLCPSLRLPAASSVMIGSGHHFGGEAGEIAAAILRVAGSRPH
jgi:type IV secretory pathway VirJ component